MPGDEGGFAPDVAGTKEALDLITIAVNKTGLKLGTDVALALDVAATEFYTDGTGYKFEGKVLSAAEMGEFYRGLIGEFPMVSIEDPLSEDDWEGWVDLTDARTPVARPDLSSFMNRATAASCTTVRPMAIR